MVRRQIHDKTFRKMGMHAITQDTLNEDVSILGPQSWSVQGPGTEMPSIKGLNEYIHVHFFYTVSVHFPVLVSSAYVCACVCVCLGGGGRMASNILYFY